MLNLPGENVYVGTFLFRSPPNLNTRLETFGLGSCCSLFPFDGGAIIPEELLTLIVYKQENVKSLILYSIKKVHTDVV
jgi:hypothetical protein